MNKLAPVRHPLRLAVAAAALVTVAAGRVEAACNPDTEPPEVVNAAMIPWDVRANAPKPPADPAAPCSVRQTYRVECGTVTDECDPFPDVQASVYVAGIEKVKKCPIFHLDVVVACGDLVDVVAVPGCKSVRPKKVKGRMVFSGFDIEASIVATDASGNLQFVPLGSLVNIPPDVPGPDQVCLPRPPDCAPDCDGGGGGGRQR